MIADDLIAFRDEAHRRLSGMWDDFRAFERDCAERVAAAEARVVEVESALADAARDLQQSSRERDGLNARIDALSEVHKAAAQDAASQIERLAGELKLSQPAVDAANAAREAADHELAAMRQTLMETERKLSAALDRAQVAEVARGEAERHEGMFRRALYTYLQERDGPAGTRAPTPETLNLIRKLVDGDS